MLSWKKKKSSIIILCPKKVVVGEKPGDCDLNYPKANFWQTK